MTKVHPLDNVINHQREIDLNDNNEEVSSPWVVKHKFPCWWVVLIIVFGPVLLILRLILIFLSLMISYVISNLSLVSCCSNQNSPPTCFISFIRHSVILIFRCLILLLGVIIRTKGVRASRADAPVLVAAPHSTILDWVLISLTRSCPVAKYELSTLPVLGTIGKVLLTVFINRESDEAKAKTKELLKQRSSEPGWPQLMIFPEGTVTNGQTLVMFKTGAFTGGQPVQPVSIQRALKSVDTISWSWVQKTSVSTLIILTLMTPLTILDVEYLPVITPDEDDLDDPRHYANTVRRVFSDHLKIGVSDQSLKEAKMMQEKIAEEKKLKKEKSLMKTKEKSKLSTNYASNTSIDFVGNLTIGT